MFMCRTLTLLQVMLAGSGLLHVCSWQELSVISAIATMEHAAWQAAHWERQYLQQ